MLDKIYLIDKRLTEDINVRVVDCTVYDDDSKKLNNFIIPTIGLSLAASKSDIYNLRMFVGESAYGYAAAERTGKYDIKAREKSLEKLGKIFGSENPEREFVFIIPAPGGGSIESLSFRVKSNDIDIYRDYAELLPVDESCRDNEIYPLHEERVISMFFKELYIKFPDGRVELFNIDRHSIANAFESVIVRDEELRDLVSKALVKMEDPAWYNIEYKPKSENKAKHQKALEKSVNQTNNKYEITYPNGKTNEIVDINALRIIEGSDHPLNELNSLIGLDDIKENIKKFYAQVMFNKSRAQDGLTNAINTNMHMCFYGNPGTGKTTVARIMTGLLYELGYIKRNCCVEVNALDLTGSFEGHSHTKTNGIVDAALGGVLFIDEAYMLNSKTGTGYEAEVLNTLIKRMEDDRENLVVIFAGYTDETKQFIHSNSGLPSRINFFYDFPNYSTENLMDIFLLLIRQRHLKADEDVLNAVTGLFKYKPLDPKFSNGRYVRNLVDKLEDQHMFNFIMDISRNGFSESKYPRMDLLTREDLSSDIYDVT